MKCGKRLVLFSLFAMNLVDQPAPEVTIEQGILSGKISGDGSFFEYVGIPYATTNSSTRFKAPLPPPSWNGVYKAIDEIYQCPQPSFIGIVGTEDCLKINVYVPSLAEKPLPVMVYIHGGAFMMGSGGKFLYAPDFLVKHNVVLVTFNYRLGALGFICLGIKEAPGNAGLKDQIAALRWVKKNIAAFGGDPDNVTIFGQSAGATSASMLLASKTTEGLFDKVIIQSGSSTSSWAINRQPLWVASLIAKDLGYDTEDPKEIYEILSKISYKKLLKARPKKPLGIYFDTQLLNYPCVEQIIDGEETVVTDYPYNILSNKPKKIPVIYGTTSKEGLFLLPEDTAESLATRNARYIFASDLEFPSEEEASNVSKMARKFYFGEKNISFEVHSTIADLNTELYFEIPAILESETLLNNKEAKVFNYYFNYAGGRNLLKFLMGFRKETGATHSDEILYLFKGLLWPFPISQNDQNVINWMTKMWTNFAKYGDPTPSNDLPVKWEPSIKDDMKFLYIDDELKLGPIPNPKAYRLWKNIFINAICNKLGGPKSPEIKIKQGILSGKVSEDESNFEHIGILYAITNSDTRFQAPLPPPKWHGVFKAIDEMYQCPQHTPFGVVGMEDCLKINVYVPVKYKKPFPVMVYIHGGAFILGNGGKMVHGPDFLVEKDVIFVTFNYRLGALGFLCLGSKDAPGNAGLKDQVAALRWIKKNIREFGGDPDNVTIFGTSAGGTSVSLLVASEATNGLFQRAIVHSGSSLAPWAVNNDPIFVASKIASLIGYDTKDPKELYEIFSKMSYKDMVSVTAHVPISRLLNSHLLLLPCVEKTIPGVESVLNDLPINLLSKNPKNIPLMYSSTSKEGLFFVDEETEETLEMNNKQSPLGYDLVFKSEKEEKRVAQKVKQFYFGKKVISTKTLMNLSDLYTHLYFEMPVILEAELMARNNDAPVFNYYFTYDGGRNLVKHNTKFRNEPGGCHGDDLLYVFKGAIWPYRIKEKDLQVIDWMTTMLTNFAKYGNPTPNDLPVRWEPHSKDKLNFLKIGDELKMTSLPNPDAFQLWKDIYNKYRRIKAD